MNLCLNDCCSLCTIRYMLGVKEKGAAVVSGQLGLAACQHFHDSLQARAKKPGGGWQFSKTNKYELNEDKTGTMYKAGPQAPLILPQKGFPHRSFLQLTVHSTQYTASASLARTHSTACTCSYFSIGCNELPSLREEAVTEAFIKHTAIWMVPRTGRSHSCMEQKGWG